MMGTPKSMEQGIGCEILSTPKSKEKGSGSGDKKNEFEAKYEEQCYS